MADVISYPFDYTGQAATNRITGEQIIITAPGDRRYHFTMVKFAPMFEEGLVLKIREIDGTITPLVKGIDYYLSHQFKDASLSTMHELWGSITFLRRDIVGVLIADYNTLGGPWTIDSQKIIEILANQTRNPRSTTWEQVVERPIDFPPIDHPWDLDDMVGMKEILEVIEKFYQAYLVHIGGGGGGSGDAALIAHMNDRTNSHKVNANQTGAYTYAQIDLMFQQYLKTNGVAADSSKLGGKTLAAIMLDVVAVKVSNAVRADTAGAADTATKATDSDRVGGKTVQDIISQISADVGGNATKFNGKTYGEAKADILSGKAADADKLSGKTLVQIMQDIANASGDAKTLEGRTYQELLLAMSGIKTSSSGRADTADSLSGKTLANIMEDVIVTVVNNAKNASKVYNLTFPELGNSLARSPDLLNGFSFAATDVIVKDVPIGHPNDGGNLDPTYTYALLGSFIIPGEDAIPTHWDNTVEVHSSSFDLSVFWKNSTDRIRVDLAYKGNAQLGQSTFKYYGEEVLSDDVVLGIRRLPSGIFTTGGVEAMSNEIWMKFKISKDLRRYGAFQGVRGGFKFTDPVNMNFWDHTSVGVGGVIWQTQSFGGGASLAEVQAAFDDLAEVIDDLIAAPAA